MSDDQAWYTANRTVFQLGGDVLQGSITGEERWHLGLVAGVEGRVSERLSLWGNVAQLLGSPGYSDTQGTLGLKYSF